MAGRLAEALSVVLAELPRASAKVADSFAFRESLRTIECD